MTRKPFVVAIAQAVQTSDLGVNFRAITGFIERAAQAEVDLVAFPECALTGYGPAHHASAAGWDPDAVEAAVEELRALAREARTGVLLGAHLPVEGGWTNSALLIGPTGRLLARYDKAHLYARDGEFYRPGRARPTIARLGGARLGMQICFDIRFPEPFRMLALGGAQLILAPSHIHGAADMWKGPVIEGHVRSRAAENGCFLAFINAAGEHQNVPSMVADPDGRLIAVADRAESQLLLARLDPRQANDRFLRVRRTDLYGAEASARTGDPE